MIILFFHGAARKLRSESHRWFEWSNGSNEPEPSLSWRILNSLDLVVNSPVVRGVPASDNPCSHLGIVPTPCHPKPLLLAPPVHAILLKYCPPHMHIDPLGIRGAGIPIDHSLGYSQSQRHQNRIYSISTELTTPCGSESILLTPRAGILPPPHPPGARTGVGIRGG